ncbi:MAG: ABC transporter substrate-binding protein [Clostridiales bacterium]|nr:ABC transporter substrate-binding protein [Clostridiales bacterium]
MGDRKVLAFKKGTDADGAEFDYVYTGDKGAVTFTVNVEAAGFYNIRLDYLTVESRGVDVERVLYINGELPFTGASTLCFSRLWTDKVKQKAVAEDGTVYYDAAVTVSGDDITVMKNGTVVYEGKGKVEEYTVKIDNQGNEIRPTQVEVYDWQTAYCRDDMGYELLPYQFYFNKGENTVTLEAVNEPFCIRGIHLVPVAELADYEQFSAAQAGREENDGTALIIVEGESAGLRSTPSLYPKYDRSSPDTYPYSVSKTLLNYIGGDAWNKANEWIEWSFEVDEPGYYLITIKGRQKYQRGAISCRSVYIDGEIPCEELSAVEFDYSTSWQNCTLKDANGDPCRFWLDKGTHTIRIEATLGAMGPILKEIEDSIYRLNQIYRKVLVLTGVNPDRFRDYNIAKTLPGVIEAMDLESRRLYRIVDETVEVTGQKSDRIAVAQTLASQLEKFVKNNDRITEQFTNFKDNITSLGTSMQNMSETKLDIDRIYIHGDKAELPDIHDGFFAGLVHEVKSCAASYFVDYNSLGDKYDEDEDDIIDVWIVTGRDQSTILKTMIDDTFTPEFGVKVNVKLVVADTLLTAVVAGNGPDVVLSLASWFPVNYAMRNAVEDLTQFDDFWDVIYGEGNWTPGEDGVPVAVDDSKAVFYPSSLVAMTYTSYSEDENGEKTIPHEGIYALPETQEYNLLFYREDVLEELGLNVPQTWEELVAMLPTIQGNNMSVGVPYPDIAAADMSVLNSLIYQHGGQIYDGDGKSTMIDNESGVQAFELYTSLYNDYGLPIVYDFVSRFRSGEMPLGVTSYTTYNTLAIAAPEIRGLWNFTYFPGTEQADGSIDRSVHAQGVCCMMIKTDDERIRNDAWTFMKWWTSADTQVRFGREIESVLGSSARYSTANRQALKQLAWSSEQLEVLQGQQAWTVGFREIAGGYSTTRHMTNAIRKVINEKEDKRETLINYARTINEEIRIKRQEFGLPLE